MDNFSKVLRIIWTIMMIVILVFVVRIKLQLKEVKEELTQMIDRIEVLEDGYYMLEEEVSKHIK